MKTKKMLVEGVSQILLASAKKKKTRRLGDADVLIRMYHGQEKSPGQKGRSNEGSAGKRPSNRMERAKG